MDLKERFQQSRRNRVRKVTIEGIGEVNVLIPSAAAHEKLRIESRDKTEEQWTSFIGTIVAQYLVNDDWERAYADDAVGQLLEDLDTDALLEIYRAILAIGQAEKNSKN